METIFPILIGTSIGFGFFYENLKLKKKYRLSLQQNNWYSKTLNSYYSLAKKAMKEREYFYKYQYKSEIWQADCELLIRELLQRKDEDGKPIFIPLYVSDYKSNKTFISLLSRNQINLSL